MIECYFNYYLYFDEFFFQNAFLYFRSFNNFYYVLIYLKNIDNIITNA